MRALGSISGPCRAGSSSGLPRPALLTPWLGCGEQEDQKEQKNPTETQETRNSLIIQSMSAAGDGGVAVQPIGIAVSLFVTVYAV